MIKGPRSAIQYLLIFGLCIGVTAWGLLSTPARRRELASPPHKYGAFTPGSWALFHETYRNGERSMESDERLEILQRTDAAVTVKMETTMTGRPPSADTQTVGLKDELTAIDGAERAGIETLTVEGRRYECVIFRRGNFQFWLAPDLPWPVKSLDREIVDGVERAATEVRLTRPSDRVLIPGRSIDCAVFEELHRVAGEVVRRSTSWKTTEIPGHEARREESFTANGEPASITRVAVKFEIK